MNPIPDDTLTEIKYALFRGDKIGAIKSYRQHTGLGLAESKTAIDQMELELRASTPEQFTKPASKGCMSMVLALLAGGGGLLYWANRL